MTMPRLVLAPYFLFALIALVILAVLRFIMRKKENIWIDRIIPLPVSYMLAHLCTKGFSFTTYSPERDLCMIALVTIIFYCAILIGASLYKKRKAKR